MVEQCDKKRTAKKTKKTTPQKQTQKTQSLPVAQSSQCHCGRHSQ